MFLFVHMKWWPDAPVCVHVMWWPDALVCPYDMVA